MSNSNVILPDRGEALCCTSLTFYNLHAAIVNVVVNLEYSTTTTVPSYTEYPNCSENVTNATTVFRYYQEDVSNQFDTWAENITLFADKSLDERRSQYFEDKSFVEEKRIIASNKASLLEEPFMVFMNCILRKYLKFKSMQKNILIFMSFIMKKVG